MIAYIKLSVKDGTTALDIADMVEGKAKLLECSDKPIEQQPSDDDCVSRQAVINEIKSMSNANPSYYIQCDVVDRENLIDYITELPSVKSTHEQSEWYLRGGKFTCKNCEERALLKLVDATGGCREYNYYTSKFCPNCGADMRGTENG